LTCIVEGKGDVAAFPNLCARLLKSLERNNWSVDKDPVRRPRGTLVDERIKSPRRPCHEAGVVKALQLAIHRRADAALVVCDADDDCAVFWAQDLARIVRKAAISLPVEAVMVVREYESWILANQSDDRLAEVGVINPEGVRGAKERLSKLVPGYLPTTHQLTMTRSLDLDFVASRSRSFRKLRDSVAKVCVQ
jgi:hypothetical protein